MPKPTEVKTTKTGVFLTYKHGAVGVPWRVWPEDFSKLLVNGWQIVVVINTETVLFRAKRKRNG